jgi:hypothetical protein
MSKDLITLLIITLLTIIAWVGFEIYHRRTVIYISSQVLEVSEPINTELDVEFIEKMSEEKN